MEEKLKKDGTPDRRYRPKKLANLNCTRVQEQITEYFNTVDPHDWSIPDLCVHLRMTKSMFKNMANDPTLANTHDYAVNMIEAQLFKELRSAKSPTGVIFALKTLGYTDKKGVDISLAGKISIENILKDAKIKA